MNYIKKHSIAITWFLSYIVVFLLFITGTLFVYYSSVSSLTENATNYNYEILTNKKQNMDRLIDGIQTATLNMLNDENVKSASKYGKELTNEQRYALVRMGGRIPNSRTVDENVTDTYIYFTNPDYIVSTTTAAASETYYNSSYKKDKFMSYEDWKKLLSSQHNGEFLVFTYGEGPERSEHIFYIKSIMDSGRVSPVGTIVLEVDRKVFVSDKSDRDFLVIDKNKKVLISDLNENERNKIEGLDFDNLDKVTNLKIKGKNCIFISLNSDVSGWTYVYLIDKTSYLSKVLYIRWVLLISSFVCFIIGVIFAIGIVKRNHRPIKNIMNMINNNMNLNAENGSNELDYIEHAIVKAIEEKNATIKQSDITESVVMDAVLAKFLGENDETGVFSPRLLESLNIKFPYSTFAVVVISIEDVDEAFFDEHGSHKENMELSKVVISNITNEMLSEKFELRSCEMSEMLVEILNTDNPDYINEIESILDKAGDFIMEQFNIEFIASISDTVDSLELVPKCFREASLAMDYRYIVAKNIIKYADISFDNTSSYSFSIETEERLMNCLRAGEYEKGKALLDDIFENNIAKSPTPIVFVRLLMYDIMATIVKLLNELKESDSNEIIEEINKLDTLGKTANITVLKSEITKLLKEFCEKKKTDTDNKLETDKVESIIENVKSYIKENYSNPDISVQLLSELNNINASYLSTVFKKNVNIGLLEYITKIRIDKAKQIIATENKTIEEVANMTGYSNSRTFSRVFVKQTGISPGKYKKSV